MIKTFSTVAEKYFCDDEIFKIVDKVVIPYLDGKKRILLIPPDITRFYAKAGLIAGYLFDKLSKSAVVDIMPALGSHLP